jgi:hypothetical protein
VRYKRAVDPGCGVRGCVGLRGPVVSVCGVGFFARSVADSVLRGSLRDFICVS